MVVHPVVAPLKSKVETELEHFDLIGHDKTSQSFALFSKRGFQVGAVTGMLKNGPVGSDERKIELEITLKSRLISATLSCLLGGIQWDVSENRLENPA